MRILSSDELVAEIAAIRDGATVAISGAGGGLLEPESVSFRGSSPASLRAVAPGA